MENDSYKYADRDKESGIIRLGGLAVLLAVTIHIVVNWVIKTMPPADLTTAELQSYFDEQVDNWAIVHGLRYVAFTCIALFSTGLFVKTCYRRDSISKAWGENPLDDIRNTRSLQVVISEGQVINREALLRKNK